MAIKNTHKLVSATGESLRAALPKVKAVHPYGSKILAEVLRADEIMGTAIHIGDDVVPDGAPQAYITELGPCVPVDAGLKVGQRVYWSGKGTMVDNPGSTTDRVNALLEINNILAIIEEA